ncbi:CLUMA_CG012942, isoform A [Clunio marinus]|uniref:CLUMA_CG012942, isoform A n=1 Tax=Clunio marinus TaxID=568069 RepID=A0A1J1IH92_9DIPT|nr:CLUMA_CG012942, isoform A [Clunio marinus]
MDDLTENALAISDDEDIRLTMVFGFILTLVSIFCNTLWFLSHFAIFLIHYFIVLLILLCVVSKFIKLNSISFESIQKVFIPNGYPLSYLGSVFDVPENSKASFEYSCSHNCPRIFFSLDMTECGQLVVLDKQTLEKANIHTPINKTKFDEIKNLNISDSHPLGKQFGYQKILTLDALLKILEPLNVVVILNATRTGSSFIEKLKQTISTHDPMFTKKIIFCCRSPIVVYKLRKLFPNLMCAIWIDNLSSWRNNKRIFKLLTILRSIHDVLLRNLIGPIIGISLVFVHKDEFNTHISELWQNCGVIPIVYFVNSPSEKRYYQNVIKTRYLTSSLRSEPQIIFNNNKI